MSNKIIKKNTPEKEHRFKSRKEVIALEIIGVVSFILGFVSILIPAVLSDDEGHYENGWIFLILFFVLLTLSVVVLLYVLPDAAALEFEEGVSKYDAKPFSVLENAGKEQVRQTFLKRGFKETPNGLFRKKIISLSKDSVCYYLALADAENIDAACENANKRLNDLQETSNFVCLIVFIYKPNVTAADEKEIKELSSVLISYESTVPLNECSTMLPVLVDTLTGKGVYLAKYHGITVYAHGCRLLRKYLK